MLVSDSEHETEAHEEDPVETDDEDDDHSDVDAEELMRLLGGNCSVDDPYFEVPDDEDGPATDVTESVPAFLERTDLDDKVETELHKSFWEKLYGMVGGETSGNAVKTSPPLLPGRKLSNSETRRLRRLLNFLRISP